MSAAIKRIPRDQRLRITAKYDRETLCFGGNVFEFIEKVMADRYTGVARVRFNCGGVMGMEFDFRQEVPIAHDEINQKRLLDRKGD